jgi:hypothetical protein
MVPADLNKPDGDTVLDPDGATVSFPDGVTVSADPPDDPPRDVELESALQAEQREPVA